jgi:hypothetical protein
MNPANPPRSLAAALLIAAAIAAPAFAKTRAVGHRTLPSEFTVPLINGTVTDAVTGKPVIGADVSGGGNRFDSTDAQGRFDLKSVTGRGSILVTVQRSGYQLASATVTPTGSTTLNIKMSSTPTTTLRLVSGETKVLDTESIKFGYPVFTGYVESESEDFCKVTDSTKVTYNRAQMAKLTGPAQTVAAGGCCTGNAQKMTLTLKNGEVMEVIFTDTCQERYKVDVDGRNHESGQFEHIPIETIAEVVFP